MARGLHVVLAAVAVEDREIVDPSGPGLRPVPFLQLPLDVRALLRGGEPDGKPETVATVCLHRYLVDAGRARGWQPGKQPPVSDYAVLARRSPGKQLPVSAG